MNLLLCLRQIALTNFYGISYDTARRLCARLQLHERATVGSLSENQITQLSAYLSSPGSIPARRAFPTTEDTGAEVKAQGGDAPLPPSMRPQAAQDPLRSIVIEADLRRQIVANITHHRNVGSYIGRRHAAGLPVRGQRTSTNANTAKKLNRVERRQFHSSPSQSQPQTSSLVDILAPLAKLRFASSA